jgi:hypothetical protein
MNAAMANKFRALLALPDGRAPSVAGKSPITARFWRQHDDGDADSDGGTERRLLEERRDANKLAGGVWRHRTTAHHYCRRRLPRRVAESSHI